VVPKGSKQFCVRRDGPVGTLDIPTHLDTVEEAVHGFLELVRVARDRGVDCAEFLAEFGERVEAIGETAHVAFESVAVAVR